MIREDVKLTPMLARIYLTLIRKHGSGMALLVNPVGHYLPAARGVTITPEDMADQQAHPAVLRCVWLDEKEQKAFKATKAYQALTETRATTVEAGAENPAERTNG
jgi:hypothetical protein